VDPAFCTAGAGLLLQSFAGLPMNIWLYRLAFFAATGHGCCCWLSPISHITVDML
jgi:hypothetical protein